MTTKSLAAALIDARSIVKEHFMVGWGTPDVDGTKTCAMGACKRAIGLKHTADKNSKPLYGKMAAALAKAAGAGITNSPETYVISLNDGAYGREKVIAAFDGAIKAALTR